MTLFVTMIVSIAAYFGSHRTRVYWRQYAESSWESADYAQAARAYKMLRGLETQDAETAYRLAISLDDSIGLPPVATTAQLADAYNALEIASQRCNPDVHSTWYKEVVSRLIWRQLQLGGIYAVKAFNLLTDSQLEMDFAQRCEMLLIARCLFETMPQLEVPGLEQQTVSGGDLLALTSESVPDCILRNVALSQVSDQSLSAFLRYCEFKRSLPEEFGPSMERLEDTLLAECGRRQTTLANVSAARVMVARGVRPEELRWLQGAVEQSLASMRQMTDRTSENSSRSSRDLLENAYLVELAGLGMEATLEVSPQLVSQWLKPLESEFASEAGSLYPVAFEISFLLCLERLGETQEAVSFGQDALLRHSKNLRLHEEVFRIAAEAGVSADVLEGLHDGWADALEGVQNFAGAEHLVGSNRNSIESQARSLQRSRWIWSVMDTLMVDAERGGWESVEQIRELVSESSSVANGERIAALRFEVDLLQRMACLGEAAYAQEQICKSLPNGEEYATLASIWFDAKSYNLALRNLEMVDAPTWELRVLKAKALWESQYEMGFPSETRAGTLAALNKMLASEECESPEERSVFRWMIALIPDGNAEFSAYLQSDSFRIKSTDVLSEIAGSEVGAWLVDSIRTARGADLVLKWLGDSGRSHGDGAGELLLKAHCLQKTDQYSLANESLQEAMEQLEASPAYVPLFVEIAVRQAQRTPSEPLIELICDACAQSKDVRPLVQVGIDSGDSEVAERICKQLLEIDHSRTDLTRMITAVKLFKNALKGTDADFVKTAEVCRDEINKVLQQRPRWAQGHAALGKVLVELMIRETVARDRGMFARSARSHLRQAVYLGSKDPKAALALRLTNAVTGESRESDGRLASTLLGDLDQESLRRTELFAALFSEPQAAAGRLTELFQDSQGLDRADGLILAVKLARQLKRLTGESVKVSDDQLVLWIEEAFALVVKIDDPQARRLRHAALEQKFLMALTIRSEEFRRFVRDQIEGSDLETQIKMNWTSALMNGEQRLELLSRFVGDQRLAELSEENAVNLAIELGNSGDRAQYLQILKSIVGTWPENVQARMMLGNELVSQSIVSPETEDPAVRQTDRRIRQGEAIREVLFESSFTQWTHRLRYAEYLLQSGGVPQYQESREICRSLLDSGSDYQTLNVKQVLVNSLLAEISESNLKPSQRMSLVQEADLSFRQILRLSKSVDIVSRYVSFLIEFGGVDGLQRARRYVIEFQKQPRAMLASFDWGLALSQRQDGLASKPEVARSWYQSVPRRLKSHALVALEKRLSASQVIQLCVDELAWRRRHSIKLQAPGLQTSGAVATELAEKFSQWLDPETLYLVTHCELPDEFDRSSIIEQMKAVFQEHPFDTNCWKMYADFLYQSGELVDSQKIYNTLLQRDPGNLTVVNNFAALAAETGIDLEFAKANLKRALAQQPNNPILLGTLEQITSPNPDPRNLVEE